MGDVIDFDGITTQDIDVEKVCEAAKDWDQVMIIGWKDDDFTMALSNSSIQEAVFLLELAKKTALDAL